MANGKGDKRRPRQVTFDEYAQRWDTVFSGIPTYATCGTCGGVGVDTMTKPAAACLDCAGAGKVEANLER